MNSSPAERFNLNDELSLYLNDLQRKGISFQLAQERMKGIDTIEAFQKAIRELLDAVVFPELTQSGEDILQAFFEGE